MEQESVETREFSRANILFSNVEAWKLYSAQSQESKPVTIIWLIWNWSCALILLGFLGVYISAIEWYEVNINVLGFSGCLRFCSMLLATTSLHKQQVNPLFSIGWISEVLNF